jgi:GNAT superfamily N-acetyltransferase
MKIELTSDLEVVTRVIKDAFQVEPWNIADMPTSEIVLRLNMFLPRQRFILAAMCDPDMRNVWSPSSKKEMVGMAWFGVTKRGEIPSEVTQYLANIAPGAPQVYYGATAVRKKWQGRGIALALKEDALQRIRHLYPECVLVTRMRSDNPRIIRINESHGFVPTGFIDTTDEGVQDQWWFKSNF